MRKTRHKNGIRYSNLIRAEAINLRKQGRTHREIVKNLKISLGSAALWTRGIITSPTQRRAILHRAAISAFTPERRKKLSDLARERLTPFREKYTASSLIEKIADFHKENGRIPLKREFNMHREYIRRFGSWNNAVRAAGFKPHDVIFSKKFSAQDGHICDSFAEKIIDDWLSRNKIVHERNVRYGHTKMTADFGIRDRRLEYFGLAGEMAMYDKIITRKRALCAALGLKLIEIYPAQLFSKDFRHCLGNILRALKT